VRPLAVVGNLSLDRVDGGEPRAGGAPFHAARALRVLGRPAIVAAKGADADRRLLVPPLVRLGLPVLWRGGETTAAFSFEYAGDLRHMVVDALGPVWSAADLRGLERAERVHAGALARSDFPAETLAALARDRRLSFDGQGLVRPARTGPLTLDADYDPEVLRHVSMLKLAEEEARVLVGEPDADGLRSLGVPEIVVTFGSEGSLVFAEGRLERVPAQPVATEVDPTGAGDAFTAAYLVSRSSGYAPVPAARRATALVAGLLGRRIA
jgi:sugar/nucleoside kinase (ribokinase family)